MTYISLGMSSTGDIEGLLKRMPFVLRAETLPKAIRDACNVVKEDAIGRITKPGYPGDKPGLVPLNKTLHVKISNNTRGVLGMVGPRRPTGAHGHLVEEGHAMVLWGTRTGGRVRGKAFLAPAADTTTGRQQAAIVNRLKQELNKLAHA